MLSRMLGKQIRRRRHTSLLSSSQQRTKKFWDKFVHAFALERGHEIVGNNILIVDQKGRGKTHLMRAMTIGLGLVAIKLLPIYVDFESSSSSPAAVVREACSQLDCQLPDLQDKNENVAYLIQHARRSEFYPFFFLDEVDSAYPELPHLWKQGGDIGKTGGCSAVAAGSGAMLRVKAFGENAALVSCGLPPRNTQLVNWNNTKYRPHRLPGLASMKSLTEYLEFKEAKVEDINNLYSCTGGNLRMIEELVFQGKKPPKESTILDEIQISFAPKAALKVVLDTIRQNQPLEPDAWNQVPVLEATLLEVTKELVTHTLSFSLLLCCFSLSLSLFFFLLFFFFFFFPPFFRSSFTSYLPMTDTRRKRWQAALNFHGRQRPYSQSA